MDRIVGVAGLVPRRHARRIRCGGGAQPRAAVAAGQTVLIHVAAGGVGSVAVQLACEAGARVIGTGRAAHRQTVLGLGAQFFVDLQHDRLEDVGEVDMVFDVIGGQNLDRSTTLVRSGGAVVSVAEPPRVQPENGRAIFSSSNPDRTQLATLERKLREGRLRPLVGAIYALEDAPAAFGPAGAGSAKPIILVIDDVP